MTEPPRRKLFQFHLSTAIVMMFVAGGLIWANIYPSYGCVGISRGWPKDFYFVPYGNAFEGLNIWHFINAWYIGVNILITSVILTTVWLLCKMLIRLRGALKSNPTMLAPLYPLHFQVHLSTALVLMFVSGGMIWANVRDQRVLRFGKILDNRIIESCEPECSEAEFLRNADGKMWTIMRWHGHGWPCCVQSTFSYNTITKDGKEDGFAPGTTWTVKGFVVNGISSMALLVTTWFLCEWLIRRRVARKGT
jgi:hypothetical protein